MRIRNKRATVFGGSNPRPGEKKYIDALRLGSKLGQLGCTVLTGGYIGTMEAVSRGAAENGGYVIGITCDEIEAYRPIGPNPWLDEEIRCATLRQRLYTLITECEIALALPGGVGTLTEIATMWNHMLTSAIAIRPLILIGSGWKRIMDELFNSFDEYISSEQRSLLIFSPDIDSAFQYMPWRDTSDFTN